MELKKIYIFFLLAILLQPFNTVSAMDSHDSAEIKMLLPKNSNNLSIKTHWQYIGYYLYKLLYENDSFSEATKAKIDKIFGINQEIIDQLDFVEDEPIRNSTYKLDLSGVFFSDEEDSEEDREETDSDDAQDSERQTTEEDTIPSAKESDSEETTPTETAASEENADGTVSSIADLSTPTEASVETTLPSDTSISATTVIPDQSLTNTNITASEEVPLYGQMGIQDATLPSGYNSLSDPNTMQQQGSMAGGYNFGYNATNGGPMYNIGQQNYEGSYSDNREQPMYGGQMYNSSMGTANNYGNSYNNMSDFQRSDQNMGMYQQQQGMYQQQNGMPNSYSQMEGMSDSQYNQYGGMTQENEGMPQYGQQIQSYGNMQQQQSGEYPPEYQSQEDMNMRSAEDMQIQQMQQQQNQMQGYPSTEDSIREQQVRLQPEQSERQVIEEDQLGTDDMENRDIESSSEMQSVDETVEVARDGANQNVIQQQFRDEISRRGTEQQQVFLPSKELVQNIGSNEAAIVENQSSFETATMSPSQQYSATPEIRIDSASPQLQSTLRKNSDVQLQATQQEQSSSYPIPPRTTTGTTWTSDSEIQPSTIVEEMGTTRGSVFDGAEWNSQRGSSTWGVVNNEAPLQFDPNAPLSSEDF